MNWIFGGCSSFEHFAYNEEKNLELRARSPNQLGESVFFMQFFDDLYMAVNSAKFEKNLG